MNKEEREHVDNAFMEIQEARYAKKSREVKAHYLQNAIYFLQKAHETLSKEVK